MSEAEQTATPVSYTHLDVYKRQLICRMVKVLGADRIIYGTDNMDDMMTPEMIMELDILEEEKHMILGGTAKRVYNL